VWMCRGDSSRGTFRTVAGTQPGSQPAREKENPKSKFQNPSRISQKHKTPGVRRFKKRSCEHIVGFIAFIPVETKPGPRLPKKNPSGQAELLTTGAWVASNQTYTYDLNNPKVVNVRKNRRKNRNSSRGWPRFAERRRCPLMLRRAWYGLKTRPPAGANRASGSGTPDQVHGNAATLMGTNEGITQRKN